MPYRAPRVAVRAVLMHQSRLLLVNAYRSEKSNLWCAPGGGVEPGSSLSDNLIREVHEETGLSVSVGAPCLVNEFADPRAGFHQVEVFFRCTLAAGTLGDWTDPEGVVTRRRFFSEADMGEVRFKPDSLPGIAWNSAPIIAYDPLETIVF